MEQDIFGRPVVTAAEKQAMTAEERRRSFESGIVWDLDTLPAGYLDGLRERAQDRIARRDAEQDRDQHGQQDIPNAS